MYRPSHFINNDPYVALKLIQDFPLGLLISVENGTVESNFLPFVVRLENEELILTTHFARSNPQWKSLGSEVLVSFQGPNRYISPVMYEGANNVPTWNYAAVQISGKPEILTDKSCLKGLLQESVSYFETRNSTNWRYELPVPLQDKLESAIVGVRIRSKATAKFKLSQNRNDQDYQAVLDYLKRSTRPSDQELLNWMMGPIKIC